MLFGVVDALFDCRDAFEHTEVGHAIPRLDLVSRKYDKLIFSHQISELQVKLLTLKSPFSPELAAETFLQLVPCVCDIFSFLPVSFVRVSAQVDVVEAD